MVGAGKSDVLPAQRGDVAWILGRNPDSSEMAQRGVEIEDLAERDAVATYAEWLAHAILTIGSNSNRTAKLATPFAQCHKREAKGASPLPQNKRALHPKGSVGSAESRFSPRSAAVRNTALECARREGLGPSGSTGMADG